VKEINYLLIKYFFASLFFLHMKATYLLPIAATVGTAGDPSLIHEGAYPFLAEALGYGYWLVYILVTTHHFH
jgi:hypothetical protein